MYFIMKISAALLFVLLIVSDVFASDILSEKKTFNKFNSSLAKQKKVIDFFTINEKIKSLKKLSEYDAETARINLQQLQQLDLKFNQAELYLLHVIRANVINVKGQEQQVIDWLNKALALAPYLNEKQANSPDFAHAYLVLANAYQQTGDYQKAFDNKKKYIKKYSADLKLQNEQRVEHLTEKYQMAKKHEENELLEQNSELKRFAFARVESQRNEQIMTITIILAAGVLFFLLLLRQFKIRRALTVLAKTDSLTQLANRRAFFSNGYNAMEHALKADSELCVLMIDIDNFRQVNDSLGHDAGDNVICLVAELASETMRSRDVFARISGEEFAAILPDANVGQARAIAERIREKIQNSVDQTPNELPVTVSIGLASVHDAKESFDHLLHLADIAMYQAKAKGGNCVCNYMPTSE